MKFAASENKLFASFSLKVITNIIIFVQKINKKTLKILNVHISHLKNCVATLPKNQPANNQNLLDLLNYHFWNFWITNYLKRVNYPRLTVGPWADVKNGFAWKIIIVLKVRGGHGE